MQSETIKKRVEWLDLFFREIILEKGQENAQEYALNMYQIFRPLGMITQIPKQNSFKGFFFLSIVTYDNSDSSP